MALAAGDGFPRGVPSARVASGKAAEVVRQTVESRHCGQFRTISYALRGVDRQGAGSELGVLVPVWPLGEQPELWARVWSPDMACSLGLLGMV